jgi:uncharacterized membrane-anchored protein YhcB (DUF1043 family)
VQVGGLGLGAAAVAFLSGAALDATGILAGLTVAGMGFLILPSRRRAAKQNLHEQMQGLRDGLSESLNGQFERELNRSAEKLSAAVSPYTRFVKSEVGRLENLQDELSTATDTLRALRREVTALSSASGAAPALPAQSTVHPSENLKK